MDHVQPEPSVEPIPEPVSDTDVLETEENIEEDSDIVTDVDSPDIVDDQNPSEDSDEPIEDDVISD